MSQESAKQILWNSSVAIDDTLAVVNNNEATYIPTNFMLGNYMTLEMCFKRISLTDTGHVIVGFMRQASLYHDDAKDYRCFFSSGKMYCDCGRVSLTNSRDSRFSAPMTDTISWHIVKFPVQDSSIARPILDGNWFGESVNQPFDATGNFGLTNMPLKFFTDMTDLQSQKVAIRYVHVWQYNSDKLLASFWPDKRGGFVDAVSGKVYYPVAGEVEVKKWEEV